MINAVGTDPLTNSPQTSSKNHSYALKLLLKTEKNTEYSFNKLRAHHMPTQPFFKARR